MRRGNGDVTRTRIRRLQNGNGFDTREYFSPQTRRTGKHKRAHSSLQSHFLESIRDNNAPHESTDGLTDDNSQM
jgi:hypothetical protein